MFARAALLYLLLIPGLANAQHTGSIRGKLTDSSGAAVADAPLSLHNAQQALIGTTLSDNVGDFAFERVPAGAYVVVADASGFAPRHLAAEVRPGQILAVDVVLTVQSVSEEVTVTADVGQVQVSTQVAQPVNVVSENEIQARTSTVLADVAKEEAGIAVQRTSPAIGAVVVRGLTEVTVFVDGIRYTNSTQRGGINTFFNLAQPGSLSGVEVLRGANSAQYGSDSLGGSVQLISRTPLFGAKDRSLRGEWSTIFTSSSTSFGSNGVLNYGGRTFGVLLSVNGRRVNTLRSGKGLDGHAAVTRFLGLRSDILGSRLPDTAFTLYGGSLRFQYTAESNQNIILHYQRTQQDGGKRYDQLLGGDGNLIADLRNLMADFGYVRYLKLGAGVFDNASMTFSASSQREERVNQGGQGNPLASITHEKERTVTYGFNFYLDKKLGPNSFLFGGDVYRDRVNAPAFTFDPVSRGVTASRPRVPHGSSYILSGIYLQDTYEVQPDLLRLSGALRFNVAAYRSRASNSPIIDGQPLFPDDSHRVSDLSGRFGVVYTPVEPVTFSLGYSRGFRAPNITSLGSVGLGGAGYQVAAADLAGRGARVGTTADAAAVSTGAAVGSLRSEISDNLDLSLHLRAAKFRTSMTGFQIDIKNVITRQTLLLPDGAVGSLLGSQRIERQLPSGAVFVPLSAAPVLVQVNFGGTRLRGLETEAELAATPALHLSAKFSFVRAQDRANGLPPNLGGAGLPPASGVASLRYSPNRRYSVEAYSTLAARQSRLSSLDLSDRRTGAARSRRNIADFFNRGARIHGLIGAGDILIPTGETLAQVQNRVLGDAESAPLFSYITGYGLVGLRGNIRFSERSNVGFDLENIADKAHRAPGWGIDGAGRSVTVRYKYEF